jgi:protein involved in polysaccharide export with SLBB domain
MSKEELGIRRMVAVRGGVWQPGEFPFTSGMTLKNLVAYAGGLKDAANLSEVEVSRQRIKDNIVETEHIKINLGDPSGPDSLSDFTLQPYDTVMIPMNRDVGTIRTVSVEGEVKYPGTYTLKRGEKISDLLDRAGGFLTTAYLYGVEYYSPSAQKVQQDSIDQMIDQLELQVGMAGSGTAQAASLKDMAEAQEARAKAAQNFIARLRTIEADGRVTVKLAELDVFRGSSYDFTLGDGDRLIVPTKPSFISVVGSVYNPSSQVHNANLTVGDYLEMAGGPTRGADTAHIYIIKANGEVVPKPGRLSFKRFYSQTLMPGDTIVVPQNLDRVPLMAMVGNVADILYKIALTARSITVL